MDMLHAFIMAVVEGLTEYLPVSSTGHLIVTSWWFGLEGQQFTKDFTVIVQLGAILAVLVEYRLRFLQSLEFYKKLFVAFLPAAVIGLLVKDQIDAILGSVAVVGWALLLGGVVLIFIDRWQPQGSSSNSQGGEGLKDVSYAQALKIGLIQCFAFIPGVSRSAATIIGGVAQGLDRKRAAEFSFFLAVPTLAGATFIKLLKIVPTLTQDHLGILLMGNVVSFLVGWASIRAFIHYLTRHGFKYFGWYRIALGILILCLI